VTRKRTQWFRRRVLYAAAMLAFVSTAADAATAVLGSSTNLREGPSTAYEVIRVVPQGATVQINGCIEGVTWCDVTYGVDTGWLSSGSLLYTGGNHHRAPLAIVGAAIGIAIITSRPRIHYRPHYRPPVIVRPPHHRPPVIVRPPHHRPPVIVRPNRPPVVVRPPHQRPPVVVRPNRPPVARPHPGRPNPPIQRPRPMPRR
jgi:uncharacterized protein YraI